MTNDNNKKKKKKHVKEKTKKKVESSSSDSDEMQKEPAAAAKNGSLKGKALSSWLSEDESSSDEEPAPPAKKQPAAAKNAKPAADCSSSSEDDDSEDEKKPAAAFCAKKPPESSTDDEPAPGKLTAGVKNTKPPGSSDSSDEESDDDETPPRKKAKVTSTADKNTSAKKESSSDDSSEDSSDDEESDLEMEDAEQRSNVKQPRKLLTPHKPLSPQTLFVGNLSFKAQKADVEKFFRNSGHNFANVRLALGKSGRCRGFAHVEFYSARAASLALSLNGRTLLDRKVRLEHARERCAYKHERDEIIRRVFVMGLDRSVSHDEMLEALGEHFGGCGEIAGISIPTKRASGIIEGVAYVYMKGKDAMESALRRHESVLGGYHLKVTKAPNKRDVVLENAEGRG